MINNFLTSDYIKTKGYTMKRLAIAVFALMLGISFTAVVSAQDKNTNKEKKEEVKQETASAEVKEVKSGKAFNTVCPVSSEDIDDPVLVEYKGKTYAVCCKSCLKKIKKDPEKYISRLSEDGKSLTKK